MNLKSNAKPRRKVIAYKNLPGRLNMVIYGLVYGLYSKLYNFGLTTDIVIYVLIGLVAAVQLFMAGSEDQVDIFSE